MLLASFSVHHKNMGKIVDFYGSDMTSICKDLITITATVVGDTTGHRFYWEQISGYPVIMPPDVTELSLAIDRNGHADDKIFRFWIDKGTYFQQYKDIRVSGAPLEIITQNMEAEGILETDDGLPGYKVSNLVVVPALDSALNGGVFKQNRTDMYVYWNLPTANPQYITSLVLQENSTGQFVDVRTYSPFETQIYTKGNANNSYRVIAKYNYYGVISSHTSPVVKFFPPNTITEYNTVSEATRHGIQEAGVIESTPTYTSRTKFVVDGQLPWDIYSNVKLEANAIESGTIYTTRTKFVVDSQLPWDICSNVKLEANAIESSVTYAAGVTRTVI